MLVARSAFLVAVLMNISVPCTKNRWTLDCPADGVSRLLWNVTLVNVPIYPASTQQTVIAVCQAVQKHT